MKSKQHSPIFITGIERSGNSLIARILQLSGAFTGKTNTMFENIELKYLTEKYIAEALPDSPHNVIGQYPFPDTTTLLIPNNWKQQVEDFLTKEGHTVDKVWLYKSAKLCQTWPLWHYAFPNARWIIVRRRTGDIVQSCMKTMHMSAFKNTPNQIAIGATNEKDAWLLWVREQEFKFIEMMSAGLNCKVIWPERMVDGDYQQIYELLDWVGLPWSNKIISTIDPLLWKSRTYKKGGQ